MKSKTLRGVRTGIALAIAGAALFGGLPVAEAAAPEFKCTQTEVDGGECLPVVVERGKDPLVAGIEQAKSMGRKEGATKFVSAAKNSVGKERSQKLTAALNDTEKVPKDTPSVTDGINDPETVIGATHYFSDTITYLYCATSGQCTTVGKLRVEFRTEAFLYPTVTLDGDLTATQGPSVTINALNCDVYEEISVLPDPQVYHWNNCDARSGLTVDALGRGVYAENWSFTGPNDYDHYNKYAVTFTPQSSGAPQFNFPYTMNLRFYHTAGSQYFAWR